MAKKITPLVFAVLCVWVAALSLPPADSAQSSSIKRLTFSGNAAAKYPCLNRDGRLVLYTTEMKEGDKTTRAIRLLDTGSGEDKELFRDGTKKAPSPYEGLDLVVGTKPALLSGDGKAAVFALSLGDSPAHPADHYLAVVDTEDKEFTAIPFPIDALKDKDFLSLGFETGNWERVSNYAISGNGQRIACVMKGHMGPQRFGHASGIVLIDVPTKTQKTLMAPDFNEGEWEWTSFPRRPLTGGAWAFGLSENGDKVLFGAQSSKDTNDYDLFIAEWEKGETHQVTDFRDRWISLADISADGEKIVFFYTGRQKQGIGTYLVNSDGTGLKQVESKTAPRIEFLDLSGDGIHIVYKHVYEGMILNLENFSEKVTFNASTPGYAEGIIPMEFPPYPSFWNPHIMSYNGGVVLLVGPPSGKETSEIYLLNTGIE